MENRGIAQTIGVEEEFFLLYPDGRAVEAVPATLLQALRDDLGERFSTEVHQATLEVKTDITRGLDDVRSQLRDNRRRLVAICADFGFSLMAGGVHPFSEGRDIAFSVDERYQYMKMNTAYPMVRYLTNALHVHIGIAQDETRFKVMNRLRFFLPLLLALSASSPVWRGRDTCMASYRSAAFDELPRTGIPERVESPQAFYAYRDFLLQYEMIVDPGMIWWDIRPSHKYPTIEIKIMDAVADIRAATAITALCQSLACYCAQDNPETEAIDSFETLYIRENKYQARHYGTAAVFVVPGLKGLSRLSLREFYDVYTAGLSGVPGTWWTADTDRICKELSVRNMAAAQKEVFSKARHRTGNDAAALASLIDFMTGITATGLENA